MDCPDCRGQSVTRANPESPVRKVRLERKDVQDRLDHRVQEEQRVSGVSRDWLDRSDGTVCPDSVV